ncbi:MerR family DNA-binding transcriptional regulator [Candidatus Amesbacteria bacterium]|nr:MerR family DNA-binding transcriptional regulator [Candidatus Amesbacteria bacterium]
MSDTLLTISQASKKLGVAAVTLRLWERLGKIKSLRTSGNQRRYSSEMLEAFQNKSITPLNPPLNLRGGNPKGEGDISFQHHVLQSPILTSAQRQVMAWTFVIVSFATAGVVVAKNTSLLSYLSSITSLPPLNLRGGTGEGDTGRIEKVLGWFKNRGFSSTTNYELSTNNQAAGAVLASETIYDDYKFQQVKILLFQLSFRINSKILK